MSAVDLSSINRAAMSAKEGYWWINAAGIALSLLIAKMSFGAYGFEAIDKALICVTCQAVAIVMAILARRALTGQMGFEGILAGAAAAGCSWWASHGIALAWAKGGDPANDWMVFFLTALEPGIFLLAEHVKEGRDALRKAQEKADRELADELAAIRAKSPDSRAKPPAQPVDDRQVGEGATIHRLKVVETARLPADLPGEPGEVITADRLAGDQPVEELPALEMPPHDRPTFKDPETHARHLITVEGVRHRNELARRVHGLTTYRAARLLDEHAPGWRLKTAAA